MSKLLLLLGPSAVGKSTIIEGLCRHDSRFIYISPYMTRPLREGEKNKISISSEMMDELWNQGELLVINEIYGYRYATPKLPITQAIAEKKFPILDWPINKISIMTRAFAGQLYTVYLSPPSIEILRRRLAKDKRDADGNRLKNAKEELKAYWSSQYSGICDFEIVAEENQISKITETIYTEFLNALLKKT